MEGRSQRKRKMRKLYLLGTGTPTPTKSRFGTSFVLQLDEDCIMFDCGPAATYKLVKAGLFPTQIDYLFFTHHHFDHNSDYPCFLLCRWDQSTGKENRLQVLGPPPTVDHRAHHRGRWSVLPRLEGACGSTSQPESTCKSRRLVTAP